MDFWHPLDLRSVVFLIAVGNALSAVVLALYRGVTRVSQTYIVGRICQAAGWFLLWQIGSTPLWLNFLASNVLLELGFSLEVLAVLSVMRKRPAVTIFYAVWLGIVIVGTTLRYLAPFTAAELNRVNIEASLYAMVIFAVPAVLLARDVAASRFMRVLAVLYAAFSLSLLARVFMLLAAREPVRLFAPNLVQSVLFVASSTVLMFGTLAYLLLLNERTVHELQAGEERYRLLADQVSSLNERLREESIRDPLTGLYNRRYLQESLGRDAAQAVRSGLPLIVVMLDIDAFKEVNDTRGHEAGDALLCAVSNTLSSQVRSSDLVCRMGGDELLVVLRSADLESAVPLCERWRSSLAGSGTTVSIGVARFRAGEETIEETVRRADATLYEAKRQGRNRVVFGDAPARG